MDQFRAYLNVKIQDGKLDEFISTIPEFVQIVESTEPEAVQFEAFVNREKREIVWLETYLNATGVDKHLGNPALNDLKTKMMPMQEGINAMYFMGTPSDQTLQGLQAYGISAGVLEPWEGMNRLTEKRNEDNVQVVSLATVSDMEAFRDYAERLRQAAIGYPGFLFQRSYQLNESQVVNQAEWASEEALLSWSAKYNELFGHEIAGLLKDLDMVGAMNEPSDRLKAIIQQWNTQVFTKVAGFTRYANSSSTVLS